jgi:hypothetical protein
MSLPEAQITSSYLIKDWRWKGHVRFGSKADMCGAQADVCFVPKADIVSDTAQQKTPGRFSVSPEGFPATKTKTS